MSSLLTAQPDIMAHPRFTSLAEWIITRTGLAYYRRHMPDLAMSITTRMHEIGIDGIDAYADLIEGDAALQSELGELAASLTIGETYFFRHPSLFKCLQDTILPPLLDQRRASRHLRIWSAGCSIGAEPYTISIILRHLLAKQTGDWKFSILGTDINRDFLTQAARGRFAAWALRGVNDALRTACFTYDGSHWTIKDQYKRDVSFRHHNLVDDFHPGGIGLHGGFDLILCRNVFIYFDNDTTVNTLLRFRDAMADGGRLIIGHSEMMPSRIDGLTQDCGPDMPVYRKTGSLSLIPTRTVVRPITPATRVAIVNPKTPSRPVPPPPPKTLDDCRDAIARDRLNPSAYLRLAALLLECKRYDEAATSTRRAIYLQRLCPYSHYLLATIRQQQGRFDEAERSFRNTLDLLNRLADADPVDNGDGLTASELRTMVKLQSGRRPHP